LAWRTIYIINKCKLSLKDNNLIYNNFEKGDILKVPLDDIDVIMLENNYSTITTALLSQLPEYNIALFTCNNFNVPNSIMCPFNGHYRHLLIAKLQMNMSEPLKKRLWKKIIQRKIEGQSYVLQIFQKEEAKLIDNLRHKVKSGDPSNVEGYSASIYWKALFGKFTRNDDNFINACLNYGYSIVRGVICRTLSVAGLLPAFGIFHCNQLNQFNLADDFLEIYRPIVDFNVIKILQETKEKKELTHNEKVKLLNILNFSVLLNNFEINVLNSVEIVIDSFVRAIKNNDYKMLEIIDFIK